MTVARAPAGGDVVAMGWDEFREWFRPRWRRGEHLGILAPTGAGKTTFAGGLFAPPRPLRKYLLAADPKGGDETLGALRLESLPDWPGDRKMDELLAHHEREGLPTLFRVGPVVQVEKDLERMRRAIADSLDGAWRMGGWT